MGRPHVGWLLFFALAGCSAQSDPGFLGGRAGGGEGPGMRAADAGSSASWPVGGKNDAGGGASQPMPTGTGTGTSAPPGSADAATAAPPEQDAAATAPPTSNCTYPAGPYGTAQGDVVDPTLSWQGYLGGAAQSSTIPITAFFDCDGSKGINALVIDQAAGWCGACQQEAPANEQLLATTWGQEGVRVLSLIIQDADGNPATVQTAEQWTQSFMITKADVAADPSFTFAGTGENGLPENVIVDPRSMTIVAVLNGYDPGDTTVDMLAQKNAK
jgi:thiol-disulfide isomerase/thioredoxin